MEYEQLERLLSQVRLFSSLSPSRIGSVLRRIQALQFPAQKVILEEGRPIRFMFIVGEGGVEVRRTDPVTGFSFLLRTMRAGDSFGEMALLSGQSYKASLTTTESSILFILDNERFRELMMEEPEISLTLNQLLAEQLISAYDQVGIQTFDLASHQGSPELMTLLPRQIMVMHKVLPVRKEGKALTLAMVQPGNLVALDDVKRYVRDMNLQPMMINEQDFNAYVEKVFPGALAAQRSRTEGRTAGERGRAGASDKAAAAATSAPAALDPAALGAFPGDEELDFIEVAAADPGDELPPLDMLASESSAGPIVRLANTTLLHAIRLGASDIHIEPQQQGLVIRYRIDGNLRVVKVLPSQIQQALVSRLKIQANLDITERRVPQDGRISSTFQKRRIDFRVSTVPGKYGEKVCLRILDNSLSNISLDKLIVHPQSYNRFRQLIEHPHGIIFVTGPTGSGKTTTLYSALGEINTPDVNISTAEDPVEYDLAGITQVQVQRAVGVDFARILRAFLRQDPDIILVGETRDAETAKTAIEAALTGHLVFTTLHTNSAAATFARLEEMNVEPFMAAAATIGVVAQRLARRVCQQCAVKEKPNPDMLAFLGFSEEELPTVMTPKGCERCNNAGFKGRVGIYEVMVMDELIRPLVSKRKSIEEIEASAVSGGMLTLANYGRWLIQQGLTTLEEVLRVITFD